MKHKCVCAFETRVHGCHVTTQGSAAIAIGVGARGEKGEGGPGGTCQLSVLFK